MVTGELRHQVDRLWDAFWSGGIANPLEVVEQLTSLIFLKLLDTPDRPIPARLRWTSFTTLPAPEMLPVVRDEVFPWLRQLNGTDMRDARLTIPTAALLARAVRLIDDLPLAGRDTKGDLYEYMLGKIAVAGQNGQFRTPRHIVRLIVAMMDPRPGEDICDPACGTAGFLVAAAEHVGGDARFHGFDLDRTMLRIAGMNMLLHGVDQPDIRYRNALTESGDGGYSMILANPPFAGTVDGQAITGGVRTRKTELLFLALILRLLRPGGRAAVIVPDGVLFGASKAHREMRRVLVEEHRLEAVVKLPGGTFKPYAGVSTAILFFSRTDERTDEGGTDGGGTDGVWFYDVTADGYSLDDRRVPLLGPDKLGPTASLTAEEHALNNLPDVLARWRRRRGGGTDRTGPSFVVPRQEIASPAYDLSLHRYRRTVPEAAGHRPPAEILDELDNLESAIRDGLAELRGMLR